MPHWTERFNGLPYEKGANGPDAFNCLHFVAHVEREQFDTIVPIVPEPEKLGEIMRAFRDQVDRSGWAKVDKPRGGDVVLMAHLKYPSHIGVYVDDVQGGGSVLHCVEGQGSALHTMFHLQAARWRVVGFYRPVERA